MTNLTTFADCAQCPVLRCCDAHVTGGSWQHAGGKEPCILKMPKYQGKQDRIMREIRNGIEEEKRIQERICRRHGE